MLGCTYNRVPLLFQGQYKEIVYRNAVSLKKEIILGYSVHSGCSVIMLVANVLVAASVLVKPSLSEK